MKSEIVIIGAIVLGTIGLIIGFSFIGRTDGIPQSGEPILSTEAELVRDYSYRHGASTAPVTLVEFADFQCPACANFYPVLKTIDEKYDDGELQVIFRHFPLSQHQFGEFASRVAEAAGAQGKFWEMHDMLYERQKEWSTERDPRETFIGYAKELGLDATLFEEDLKNQELIDHIRQDRGDGITLGVDSTPSLFLNGKPFQFSGEAALREAIDAALKNKP
jgi:protein-disulfide isomerase